MNQKYKYFRNEDIDKLYNAFVKAFSEYYVNFNPSMKQFHTRIFNKLNIQPDISGLIWENQEVLGFILHTINNYQGIKTAYNGGTGMVPERRKRKLMTGLYEKLLLEIGGYEADRVLLEVIKENQKAIRFYEAVGFQYNRTFHCFKTYRTYKPINTVRIKTSKAFKEEYEKLWDFRPSFLDDSNQLVHNLDKELILEAYIKEELAGYVIFQPNLGRISQIAVKRELRGSNVGKGLLAHAQANSLNKRLTIMNIPEQEKDTIESLTSLGFKNEISQFEMELKL